MGVAARSCGRLDRQVTAVKLGRGVAVAAAGLLQRGSGLYGPNLGPAGPDWDWCAPVGGFTGPLGPAEPNWDRYALWPRPVDYRLRRWRQFPPPQPQYC